MKRSGQGAIEQEGKEEEEENHQQYQNSLGPWMC